MSKIGLNIQNIRKKLGFTAADFAEALGIPCRTYQGYERSERNFPHEIILKIVKQYDANLDYIYTGVSSMFNKNTQNECCSIPVYGNTLNKYFGSDKETFSISREFISDIDSNPAHLTVVFAIGNTMEPLIFNGDILLVDTSQKEIYDGVLYCIETEGKIYSKRLQRLSKNAIGIISDNPKYEMIKTDINSIKIIGKIKGISRIIN